MSFVNIEEDLTSHDTVQHLKIRSIPENFFILREFVYVCSPKFVQVPHLCLHIVYGQVITVAPVTIIRNWTFRLISS